GSRRSRARPCPPASSRVLQLFQGRIQGAEASVSRLIRVVPRGVRLDSLADLYTRRDRGVDVAEDTARNATEERRTERGSFLHNSSLERDPEYRRDDPQPEPAARAAAGDAADLGLDPEAAHQLERIAQPVGDGLEHRADDRAAIVADREADKSRASVR